MFKWEATQAWAVTSYPRVQDGGCTHSCTTHIVYQLRSGRPNFSTDSQQGKKTTQFIFIENEKLD